VMYSWAGEEKRGFDGPFKLQSTTQYRAGGLRGPSLHLVGRVRLGKVKGDRPQAAAELGECWIVGIEKDESTP